MMISESIYVVKSTSRFDKKIKSIVKQNKSIDKLVDVIYKIANNIELEEKYHNHKLVMINIIENAMNAILSLIGC